jgi:hypothetical protein
LLFCHKTWRNLVTFVTHFLPTQCPF